MTDTKKDRLFELLADRTVFGLSADEEMELGRLKNQFPDWEKNFSLELTAAAISLSELDVSEELPANLRTQIFANAEEFFSSHEQPQNVVNFTPRTNLSAVPTAAAETAPSRPVWQWFGWAVAAAACVALAVNLWTTRSSRPAPEIAKNPPVAQTPTPKLSPEQERAQLLAAAGDAVKIALANPKNDKEILGEIVWSNSLQKGYARLNNLPVNDTAEETYQFWIVDEAQNPKTPLSGGVFNVAATGESIVPIDPQLVVKKPLAVAVTKEKPGGVVVSAPERVVAIAKI